MSHSVINPAIFYWGTPVVLITTENEDGTYNIAPMSSVWWIGDMAMLGLERISQTTLNLLRTKQCVLNLPSDDMARPVNALARTTGTPIVPVGKLGRGYCHIKDKFGHAGLTSQPSDLISPPRIKECPVQMEAKLLHVHEFMTGLMAPDQGLAVALEVSILRTHVVDSLRLAGHANRVDPDMWRPMIMSFQHLYGLRDGKIIDSHLAEIDEELYRVPPEFAESR